MRVPLLKSLVLAAVGLLPFGAQAQTASPAMLGNTCAGCHGTDGKSPGRMPALYGMGSSAIASAMRRFKNDTRPSTIMGRIARGYTDDEIQAIADYFASIK